MSSSTNSTDTLELFLKVINQSEKIEEIWMQVELIKNEIEQLNEKEQRTMYKNEDNFEKFAKLQLETKQIREELKKVNEKILFMIEYNDN